MKEKSRKRREAKVGKPIADFIVALAMCVVAILEIMAWAELGYKWIAAMKIVATLLTIVNSLSREEEK